MNFSKTAISLVPVRKRLKTENGKRKTEKPKATLRGHCEERSNLEAITSNANGGEAPRSGQTGLLRRKDLKICKSHCFQLYGHHHLQNASLRGTE